MTLVRALKCGACEGGGKVPSATGGGGTVAKAPDDWGSPGRRVGGVDANEGGATVGAAAKAAIEGEKTVEVGVRGKRPRATVDGGEMAERGAVEEKRPAAAGAGVEEGPKAGAAGEDKPAAGAAKGAGEVGNAEEGAETGEPTANATRGGPRGGPEEEEEEGVATGATKGGEGANTGAAGGVRAGDVSERSSPGDETALRNSVGAESSPEGVAGRGEN